MYQNIIPYDFTKWSALLWSLSIKHAVKKAWNDDCGFLNWVECDLPKGKYAFCFDLENNTLYVEKVEG